MIAMITVIAEKSTSSWAIIGMDGFHMIAAITTITEKVNEEHCSRQHDGCESSAPAWSLFFFIFSTYRCRRHRRRGERQSPIDFGFKRPSRSIFAVATITARSLQSLENGFHMIATIAEIELKSISAIIVALIAAIVTIAGEWFPYDRYNRWTFFRDCSDHMETSLKCTVYCTAHTGVSCHLVCDFSFLVPMPKATFWVH